LLYESFLSYLGLGVQPPMASGVRLFRRRGPDQSDSHLLVDDCLSGRRFGFNTFALNFLGDGLRDAWDVKG